jgi:3'(2'), 5'-bisphosphate nucleotidase
MQSAAIGESTVAPICPGDTPHLRNRQGPRTGKRTWHLTSGSEILPTDAAQFIDDLTRMIARASARICALSPHTLIKRTKVDQSPVTEADEASEAMILQDLEHLLPGVPVISEESAGNKRVPQAGESFLIVDPLDGTREFLAGRDEFTVNLAIVTGGIPIAGIIAAPQRGQVWRGIVGQGAERLRMLADSADQPEAIRSRNWPAKNAVATVSRSHFDADTDAFLNSLGRLTRTASGSALKFCQIAEGSADIYPRLATTCEWDVAAGHALVVAAGGVVASPRGTALHYGRAAENFRVPAFIAWGDARKAATVRI